MCCWISPGMTPVVQIIDTPVAFLLKRKIQKFKVQLLRSLRTKAMAQGRSEISSAMSPWELLHVLRPAVQEFLEESHRSKLVLKAARQNGMLAWQAAEGKLVKITEGNTPRIAQSGELGCHRYPT